MTVPTECQLQPARGRAHSLHLTIEAYLPDLVVHAIQVPGVNLLADHIGQARTVEATS